MNKLLVKQQVACRRMRPEFPLGTPQGYARLAESCWRTQPHERCVAAALSRNAGFGMARCRCPIDAGAMSCCCCCCC